MATDEAYEAAARAPFGSDSAWDEWLGMDERATVVASIVPERRVTTLVVRYGEWLSAVAWLVVVAIVAWARVPIRERAARGFRGPN